MLGTYFYHKLTRKYVVLFGNVFNNITLVRTNRDNSSEIERFKVPVVYGPKEKYYVRKEGDPDFTKAVQVNLPIMSFSLVGISIDSSRQQNRLQRTAKGDNTSGVKTQYMGAPYDLNFELNVYTRTIDDGTHIVEQILPYFTPDLTIPIIPIPEIGFVRDIPITLNSVQNDIEYEGDYDSERIVTWTLTFTMKVYYYGPVYEPKIIRKVIANINSYNLERGYIIKMNLDEGNSGTFKIDDIVYQGNNYETATAYGTVLAWSEGTGKLTIGGAQGNFTTNNKIRAASTNATYNIASFDATPIKYATIIIEPDPIDADPNEEFGYATTIREWPQTE